MSVNLISPCLWFDDQAEQAVAFYTSVFKNSKVLRTARYPNVGQEIHGKPAGSVMTIDFELNGTPFTALNGGPIFKFNEAISLQVLCDTQDEIDYYWEKLSAGGDSKAQACGWLKDKFGVSWQVAPKPFVDMFKDHTSAKTERAMAALLKMKKLDMAELQRAYDGK